MPRRTPPISHTPTRDTAFSAMFALSTVSPRVVATPTTSKARVVSKAGRPVVTRAASNDVLDGRLSSVPTQNTSRRAFAASTLAAVFTAATPGTALAFGSGIPGYDLNEKARDAQRQAIKDELGEQRELARIEKEKRRKAREEEEAAAAAAEAEAVK